MFFSFGEGFQIKTLFVWLHNTCFQINIYRKYSYAIIMNTIFVMPEIN